MKTISSIRALWENVVALKRAFGFHDSSPTLLDFLVYLVRQPWCPRTRRAWPAPRQQKAYGGLDLPGCDGWALVIVMTCDASPAMRSNISFTRSSWCHRLGDSSVRVDLLQHFVRTRVALLAAALALLFRLFSAPWLPPSWSPSWGRGRFSRFEHDGRRSDRINWPRKLKNTVYRAGLFL